MPNTIVTIDDSSEAYFMWDLHGAGGLGSSSPGIVNSGKIGAQYPTRRNRGIARRNRFTAGLTKYMATLKVDSTIDSKPLFQNALRGSAQLPPALKVHAGTPKLGWAYDYVYINSAKWSFSDMEAPVQFDWELMGLNGQSGSGAVSQTAEGSEPWTALDAVLLINGLDYICVKAEGEVKNGLKPRTHSGPKTKWRDPTFVEPGSEEHTVKVTLETPMPDDPTINFPNTSIGLVTTFTNAAGGLFVCTYSGLAYDDGSYQQDIKNEGEEPWDFVFAGEWGCVVIT